MSRKYISILLPNLHGGGTERVNLDLAHQFTQKGHHVEFVLMKARGEFLVEAKSKFSVIDLNCSRTRNLPASLFRYLRKNRPEVLIASIWPITVIAPVVQYLSSYRCKVLISEHNSLSIQYHSWGWINWVVMRISMALGYRFAHTRVGVSSGVVDDIVKLSGLSREMFEVVHNPIKPYSDPSKQAIKKTEDLWSCPLGARIVTVGSFKAQKNHKLLLRAFASLNNPKARLMFVGDGEERQSLLLLASELGVSDQVIFAGFQMDPTPFYITADLFVLSSDYEGFGNVIVEALACGTPVVSTNCPSGPAEILDNGRFGRLVPVGNVSALANAIHQELKSYVNKKSLIQRANVFLPEVAAENYLRLIMR